MKYLALFFLLSYNQTLYAQTANDSLSQDAYSDFYNLIEKSAPNADTEGSSKLYCYEFHTNSIGKILSLYLITFSNNKEKLVTDTIFLKKDYYINFQQFINKECKKQTCNKNTDYIIVQPILKVNIASDKIGEKNVLVNNSIVTQLLRYVKSLFQTKSEYCLILLDLIEQHKLPREVD